MSSEDRDDDEELFREAMAGVRPLDNDQVEPWKQKKSPAQIQQQEQREVLQDMMSDEMPIDEVEAGEALSFARDGIGPKIMRDLRRGRFAIEAELDLHRLTRDQARSSLAVFLSEAVAAGRRCVRVIHGKGYGSYNKTPVLKGLTARWLMQRDEVLAYVSARPVDGGTGAVYVLLKRPRA